MQPSPTCLTAMFTRLAVGLACLTLCVGCAGSRPAPVRVSGSARLDDKPLTFGVVLLTSEDGSIVRQGDIQEDGTFAVVDVPPGKFKATIKDLPRPEPLRFDAKGRILPTTRPKGVSIPVKYQDARTTPLTFDSEQASILELRLRTRG